MTSSKTGKRLEKPHVRIRFYLRLVSVCFLLLVGAREGSAEGWPGTKEMVLGTVELVQCDTLTSQNSSLVKSSQFAERIAQYNNVLVVHAKMLRTRRVFYRRASHHYKDSIQDKEILEVRNWQEREGPQALEFLIKVGLGVGCEDLLLRRFVNVQNSVNFSDGHGFFSVPWGLGLIDESDWRKFEDVAKKLPTKLHTEESRKDTVTIDGKTFFVTNGNLSLYD